jgi:hypothetical protein
VADFVGNGEIYTTDLNTVDKHINGAINELHAINGYSYDAYDDTSTYAVGDLCIYNNALYKCTTAITTAEAWNASHWTATSIADEIGAKADASTTYTKSEVDTALSAKANSSTVNDILTRLDGYTITTYTLDGNATLLSLPSYNDACLIFISRGGAGLFMGHWTGVTPIVNDTNFDVRYYSNPSRINITNNSPTTARITVIRK